MGATEVKESKSVVARRWRAITAAVVTVVGVAALLLWMETLQTGANPYVIVSQGQQGYVARKAPYDAFNNIWLMVRGVMGAYITFVFFIIAGQLVGTWRRYIVEGGDD
jgi:anti-sigma-K factor RskA